LLAIHLDRQPPNRLQGGANGVLTWFRQAHIGLQTAEELIYGWVFP
jgi:hypothetical protein